MALSDTWESLNDMVWPLLETLRLADFFEDYNIPPIVLPLGVVLLILLLLVLMSSGGPPPEIEPVCGDAFCQVGEADTCPEDCIDVEVPTGKRVVLQLDDTPDCQLTVKIYSAGAVYLNTQKGTEELFTFEAIDKDSVYFVIEGAQGKSQTTSTIKLDDEESIKVTLEEDICEGTLSTDGVLQLNIKDASTLTELNGVKVSIVETQNGQVINEYAESLVNGRRDFSLPHSQSYTIYAEKEGYAPYDGTGDVVYIPPDRPVPKAITLTPLASDDETGDLEVCARSGTTPLESGTITVQGLADDFWLPGDLSNVDPATEPSGSGCYVFQGIPAGKIVAISMSPAPSGCVPVSTEAVTIPPAQREQVFLDLDCQPSDVGFLKVKVLGDNKVLTQNATITVWTQDNKLIPGVGIGSSLAIGTDGYTEEVTVPSDAAVYVWVRGLPLGYFDYKSELITVAFDEHRAFDIDLNFTEPAIQAENFTFSGVSVPKILYLNQSFQAIVGKILYEETELTGGNAKLKVAVGSNKCDVFYDNKWSADCIAPDSPGNYDLVMTVSHKKKTESHIISVQVRDYQPGLGVLTITPLFTTRGEPPLDLFYDISLNGTNVTELVVQNITATYLDSPKAYPGEIGELLYLEESGYWTLEADVPFRGDYELDVYLEVFSDGIFYNASYVLSFTSTSNSDALEAEVLLSDNLLNVYESFTTEVILTFDGKEVYGLEIFEVFMDDVFYTLNWKSSEHVYKISMASPASESCAEKLRFIIKDEEISDPSQIHAIDLTGTKSGVCPMERDDSCSSIEDVRKCLNDYETRMAYYSEDQLLVCVKSGCGGTLFECETSNKGDMDFSCSLDDTDIDIFRDYLDIVSSATDRNRLSPCLDMDNDDDVDKDDLTCLGNLVSTKWYGDVELEADPEDLDCYGTMNGGFCFDIDTLSPLPGDIYYDGNLNKDDEEVMDEVIDAVSAGVGAHEDILGVADYNQDGTVDDFDLKCLQSFFMVDFDTGEVIPSGKVIAPECMAIFDMKCHDDRGDLNADGEIEIIDLIIRKFIDEEMLSVGNLTECADVDDNGLLDEYDVECLDAYFTDQEQWLSCLECEANLPSEAYSIYEICNDDLDNNCDGLTDDEDPLCTCSASTPCDMKWDSDGGASYGVDDDNYKICRNGDWDDLDWHWYQQEDAECVEDRGCAYMQCETKEFKCAGEDGKGKWFELPDYTCCFTRYNKKGSQNFGYLEPFEWSHDFEAGDKYWRTEYRCFTESYLSEVGLTCGQVLWDLGIGGTEPAANGEGGEGGEGDEGYRTGEGSSQRVAGGFSPTGDVVGVVGVVGGTVSITSSMVSLNSIALPSCACDHKYGKDDSCALDYYLPAEGSESLAGDGWDNDCFNGPC